MDSVTIEAFGVSVVLDAPDGAFLTEDSLWRNRNIYQPFFCANLMPPVGVGVDIGAGFGAFAIPFCLANPGWHLWCFEPLPENQECLKSNVARLRLDNITVVKAAVVDSANLFGPEAIAEIKGADLAGLGGGLTCRKALLRRNVRNNSYVDAGIDTESEDWTHCEVSAVSSAVLQSINPCLIKCTAPKTEQSILASAQDCSKLRYIVGETWMHVPTELLAEGRTGVQSAYLPVAGTPFCLSVDRSDRDWDDALDVVVSMYNSEKWINECIEGIVNAGNDEVTALIVDDGSTDSSLEVI